MVGGEVGFCSLGVVGEVAEAGVEIGGVLADLGELFGGEGVAEGLVCCADDFADLAGAGDASGEVFEVLGIAGEDGVLLGLEMGV